MTRFLFSPNGRVSRRGIWIFLIAYFAIHTATHVADHSLGLTDKLDEAGPLMTIFSIAALWPSIVVDIKRFHDRDMSGWWLLWFILLTAIPLCGFMVIHLDQLEALQGGTLEGLQISPLGYAALAAAVFVQITQFVILLVLPGRKGDNRYGPDPLAR